MQLLNVTQTPVLKDTAQCVNLIRLGDNLEESGGPPTPLVGGTGPPIVRKVYEIGSLNEIMTSAVLQTEAAYQETDEVGKHLGKYRDQSIDYECDRAPLVPSNHPEEVRTIGICSDMLER
ncbi:hypothetical protein RB195_017025 [Necator americanus]|uniref:Uncharacterized protein n=1 Tax=Necator americanus TaxID=51031 RepID=A0ABR1C385_NECAM